MGSYGYVMPLTAIKGKQLGDRTLVPWTMLNSLERAWKKRLPRAHLEYARRWFRWGDDSVLTLAFNKSGDEARLTWEFYDTVYWARALADHWLRLALREGKNFAGPLRVQGWRCGPLEWCKTDGDHFFVHDGKIGHSDGEKVWWQFPDAPNEVPALTTLPPGVRKRAKAVAAGGPCECPYCHK